MYYEASGLDAEGLFLAKNLVFDYNTRYVMGLSKVSVLGLIQENFFSFLYLSKYLLTDSNRTIPHKHGIT